MNLEEEIEVTCPFCGAVFMTCADTSEGSFSMIEDCQVCCRPIEISVACHAGEVEGVEVDRS